MEGIFIKGAEIISMLGFDFNHCLTWSPMMDTIVSHCVESVWDVFAGFWIHLLVLSCCHCWIVVEIDNCRSSEFLQTTYSSYFSSNLTLSKSSILATVTQP